VQPYPPASQARWQVSIEGGTAPGWAPNGAELLYLDESNTLMAVPVKTSGTQFRHGKPAKVFETTTPATSTPTMYRLTESGF
jgi:hypothetical protein